MCATCLNTPCHPRCPNAPEPKPLYTCKKCKDGIYAGDKFFDGPDGYVCEDCIEDMTGEEIIKMCGMGLQTAEMED